MAQPIVVLSLFLMSPLEDAPSAAKLQLARGVSLQKQGKYDEAISTLEGARKLPAPVELQAEIALEIAQTYFRKAKDAFDGELPGVGHEALLKKAVTLYTDVVSKYRQVTDEAALAAYMKGSSYLLLGDTEKALAGYEQAYRDFPTSEHRPKALIRLGVCNAGLGNAAKADQYYREFLSAYPNDPSAKKVRQYRYQMGIVGRPAPTLRVSRWLQGVVPTGLEDLRGEVIVLVFIASWCTNCSAELPHLRREIEAWSPRGALFLGVADPDDPKSEQPIEFYVQENRINFLDIALDKGGRSWAPYRVTGLPAAVVIDRKGNVRWRGHFAFFPRALVARLLAE